MIAFRNSNGASPTTQELVRETRLHWRTVSKSMAVLVKDRAVEQDDSGWVASEPKNWPVDPGPFRLLPETSRPPADVWRENGWNWTQFIASTWVPLPNSRPTVMVGKQGRRFTVTHAYVYGMLASLVRQNEKDGQGQVLVRAPAQLRNLTGLDRRSVHSSLKMLVAAGLIKATTSRGKYNIAVLPYDKHPIYVGPATPAGSMSDQGPACDPEPQVGTPQAAVEKPTERRAPAEVATPSGRGEAVGQKLEGLATRDDVIASCTGKTQYGVWPSDAANIWPLVDRVRLTKKQWACVVVRANELAAEMTYSSMLAPNLVRVMENLVEARKGKEAA